MCVENRSHFTHSHRRDRIRIKTSCDRISSGCPLHLMADNVHRRPHSPKWLSPNARLGARRHSDWRYPNGQPDFGRTKTRHYFPPVFFEQEEASKKLLEKEALYFFEAAFRGSVRKSTRNSSRCGREFTTMRASVANRAACRGIDRVELFCPKEISRNAGRLIRNTLTKSAERTSDRVKLLGAQRDSDQCKARVSLSGRLSRCAAPGYVMIQIKLCADVDQ